MKVPAPHEANEAEEASEKEAAATPTPSTYESPISTSQSAGSIENTKSVATKVVNVNAAAPENLSNES